VSLGLVLAVGYALGWLPMFVLRVETMSDGMRVYRRGERLAVLLAPAILSLHVTIACVLLSVSPAPSPWRLGLAAACFGSALAFWLWGRAQIGPPRVKRPPGAAPLAFRQDGAFGIVRHPLYASYLLAALAPLVARDDFVLLPTFAGCLAILAVRAVQEERRLRQQLGAAYDEYGRRVKRVIPFVW
jgi:protein-S-isoprenylcysteine O-methyltransferase Ste14